MSRITELQTALERSQLRARATQDEIERFIIDIDTGTDEAAARSRRKLAGDLHMALIDCEILQEMLNRAICELGGGA